MLGEIKKSILDVHLKKHPRQIQLPVKYVKMDFFVKIVIEFKLQTSFPIYFRCVSGSEFASNQTFFENNKRAQIKVNNRNTKKTGARCEICLKLTVRTPEQRQ